MSYEFTRNRVDAAKEVAKALPAAGANATTDPIDLEQEIGGIIEAIAFEIEIPALPALVEAKTLVVTVQDSADGVTFAAVEPAITLTLTGGTGNGHAGKTARFRLPPSARRYVALKLAVETGGGNNTAVEASFRALF